MIRKQLIIITCDLFDVFMSLYLFYFCLKTHKNYFYFFFLILENDIHIDFISPSAFSIINAKLCVNGIDTIYAQLFVKRKCTLPSLIEQLNNCTKMHCIWHFVCIFLSISLFEIFDRHCFVCILKLTVFGTGSHTYSHH